MPPCWLTVPQRDKPSRKKRANGEGSWFERVRTLPTGTVVKDWVFIVSLGIDPLTGKRIRRSFHGKRKSDVLLKYERAREQQGGVKRPDPLTVETYLKAWLLEVERFKSGPTKRFYEGRITRYAIPAIGKIRLENLGNEDIARMYQHLESEGVSADNVQKLHRALRRAFNVAIGKGKLRSNPCAHVERRPHRTGQRTVLNAEQVTAFLKAAKGDRLEAMWRLSILNALRPGEAYALQWDDINLAKRFVHIRHGLQEDAPRALVPAKAGSARRVPIDEDTARALTAHREAMKGEKHGSAFVFVTKNGAWLAPSKVRAMLKVLCLKAGVPVIEPYGLRHSGISLYSEIGGVAIRTVADLAGHEDVELTLGTYTTTTSEMHRAAVEKAAAAVKAA